MQIVLCLCAGRWGWRGVMGLKRTYLIMSSIISIYQKRVSGNPRVFAVGSCCVYKINANEQEQSRIFIWKFCAQIKIWRRFCWWYFHLNPTNWCHTGKAYCDTNYVKNGGISSATSHFACEIHNFSCQLLWEIVHDSYSDFSEHNE